MLQIVVKIRIKITSRLAPRRFAKQKFRAANFFWGAGGAMPAGLAVKGVFANSKQ
jgi:hypothetical protein